jgi:hypothetical protein
MAESDRCEMCLTVVTVAKMITTQTTPVSAEKRLGLRKTRTFNMADIHEQIKARAREDGISFRTLAAEIGCGYYFLKPRKSGICDFNKVAKAVEFFGGHLVIDWQDE